MKARISQILCVPLAFAIISCSGAGGDGALYNEWLAPAGAIGAGAIANAATNGEHKDEVTAIAAGATYKGIQAAQQQGIGKKQAQEDKRNRELKQEAETY